MKDQEEISFLLVGDYKEAIRVAQKDEARRKQLMKEYRQACFNCVRRTNGEREALEQMAVTEKSTIDIIKRHAKEYWCEILGRSEEEYFAMFPLLRIKAIRESSRCGNLFQKLRYETDPMKIHQLIDEFTPSELTLKIRRIKSLIKYVPDFVYAFLPTHKDYLIEELQTKLNGYLEILVEDKKKLDVQQKLIKVELGVQRKQAEYENGKEILLNYINGGCSTKQEYCDSTGISLVLLDKMISLAEIYDPDTYQGYMQKVKTQQAKNYAMIQGKVKKILTFIQTGVLMENNTVRPFDILDYYQYCHLDFDELFTFAKQNYQIVSSDLRILKIFVSKNKRSIYYRPTEIEAIRKSTQIVEVQKDQQGNLILGTGREFTLEETDMLINFLNAIGVPLNARNYKIAQRRYLSGTLPLLSEVDSPIKQSVTKVRGLT